MTRNPTQERLAMRDNGWLPLPACGKAVFLPKWSTKTAVTREEILDWKAHSDWSNTGALCFKVGAIDGDFTDPEIADILQLEIADWFASQDKKILPRRGNIPKFLIPFRVDEPFAKMERWFRAPNGALHHFEILQAGQQFIAFGYNADAKRDYDWPSGSPLDTTPGELPILAEDDARRLLDHLTALLVEQFGYAPIDKPVKANGHAAGDDRGPIDVDIALTNIAYGNIHDTWLRCMGSELNLGIPADDVYQHLIEATEQSPACQADPRRRGWRKRLAAMMTSWLCREPGFVRNLSEPLQLQWHTTLQDGGKPRLIWSRGQLQLQAPRTKPEQDRASNDSAAAPQRFVVSAKPFQPFDPASLPRREWLYGGHYQRGIATATVGAGGGGKSSLGLVELIAICTGKNLLGEEPKARCRAWFHNAEEPLIEIHRRIAAICQYYAIDQAELEGWLFVTSGIDMPIKIGTSRSGKLTVDAVTTAAITHTITENNIGVACFDPLIAHHAAGENVTGEMDQICREFIRIANATRCAVEFVHHTRKPAPGQEELSVADSRGAGAIKDAVRSMRVLNTMSKTEADKLGVDDVDRRLHFRVDNGKANMSPPSEARWHKLVGVDLPNGDSVGVVTQWYYPEAKDLDVPAAVCVRIQEEVAQTEYRAAPQSPNWVGRLVARLLRLSTDKSGRAGIGRYLESLYNKGVITVADGSTGRHRVSVVVPGPWRAP